VEIQVENSDFKFSKKILNLAHGAENFHKFNSFGSSIQCALAQCQIRAHFGKISEKNLSFFADLLDYF
jgi:hypothetical protein